MPMTAFNGVRISWLMFARNVLLARLAASAASLALYQGGLGLLSGFHFGRQQITGNGNALQPLGHRVKRTAELGNFIFTGNPGLNGEVAFSECFRSQNKAGEPAGYHPGENGRDARSDQQKESRKPCDQFYNVNDVLLL